MAITLQDLKYDQDTLTLRFSGKLTELQDTKARLKDNEAFKHWPFEKHVSTQWKDVALFNGVERELEVGIGKVRGMLLENPLSCLLKAIGAENIRCAPPINIDVRLTDKGTTSVTGPHGTITNTHWSPSIVLSLAKPVADDKAYIYNQLLSAYVNTWQPLTQILGSSQNNENPPKIEFGLRHSSNARHLCEAFARQAANDNAARLGFHVVSPGRSP